MRVFTVILLSLCLVSTAHADLCPLDSTKSMPGVCGCGVPDTDQNRNQITDCLADQDIIEQIQSIERSLLLLKTTKRGPVTPRAKRSAQVISRESRQLAQFFETTVAPLRFRGADQSASAESFASAVQQLRQITRRPAALSSRNRSRGLALTTTLRSLLP